LLHKITNGGKHYFVLKNELFGFCIRNEIADKGAVIEAAKKLQKNKIEEIETNVKDRLESINLKSLME